ncbi:MAG: DUF1513 domain-containing protein [Hyphomicrobiales bacterium]
MDWLATSQLVDRRSFMKSTGAAFATGLLPRQAFALSASDAVLASAYRDRNGTFGVAVLSEQGEILWQQALPSRGHDVVFGPTGETLVVFARRPGTFAVAIDLGHKQNSSTILSPSDRHFYGHGCFSADGKLLYATENDFENAKGKLGIYDASDNYRRIGEFETFGIGPHDMGLMSDGRIILVANGGIETHPDFLRTKLNLSTMRPNLSFIDTKDGSLLAQFELPKTHHKLSIRHLAKAGEASAWFACQNQDELSDLKPLVGRVSLVSGKLELLELPDAVLAGLRGYVGSIACDNESAQIAITSPRVGIAHIIDPSTNTIKETISQKDICGVAAQNNRFMLSSGGGFFDGHQMPLHWDNHLTSNITSSA